VKKQLVHRPQKSLRMIHSNRALASYVGLQIRHQQSAADSLARNIAGHKSHVLTPKIEKVEIIATHSPRLNADSRVIERRKRRLVLREQARLHLFRNISLLPQQTLERLPVSNRLALLFDLPRRFVKTEEDERIPVRI